MSKTISILLEYKGKLYESNFQEVNDDQYKDALAMLDGVSEGRATSFQIESGENRHFFPSSVLSESVITLVTK